MHMRYVIARKVAGPRSEIRTHIERGEEMRQMIAHVWGVHTPYQWRVRHVRWVLETALAELSLETRHKYWESMRCVLQAMGRLEGWSRHLHGPWRAPGNA